MKKEKYIVGKKVDNYTSRNIEKERKKEEIENGKKTNKQTKNRNK